MTQTILLVTHGAFLSRDHVTTGNSVRGYYLSKGLVDHGIRVFYACLRDLSGGATAPDISDVSLAEFGDRRELASLIDQVAPNAILVGYWELLELLPERISVPVIVDLLAPRILETRFQEKRSLADEIGRMVRLYRKADRFITGTTRQKDLLLPWLMLAGFDCREHVPIDVIPISTEPAKPRSIEEPDPVWKIVTAGVDWPWRHSGDYLAATASALGVPSGIRGELWWISGAYPYDRRSEDSLPHGETATAQNPLVHRLPLLPYGDMEDLLQRCHIGMELSEYNVEREYSLSFRSIEYLRCGLPVVCNDYLELAGHVKDYTAGWVVSSPQAVPPLLSSIAANPADYARRSEGAIRLVRDRFHYRETIRPLLQFLQQPVVPLRARSPLAVQAGTLHRHQIKVREQSLLLQERSRQVDDLKSLLGEQQARLGELQNRFDDLRREVEESREALQQRERLLEDAHANLKEVRGELEALRRALILAEARNQEILASHSWRVTAPLRGLSRALRSAISVWRTRRPKLPYLLAGGLGRSTTLRFLRQAWSPPPEAGCAGPDNQISAVDGVNRQPRPARRRSGRHIAIVTRKDLFPSDHGAAVKIERTAWGLSHYADAVLVVTADWMHYWVFEQGRMRRACYPRFIRFSGALERRAVRKLRRIGVPDKEAFLFYSIFDWSYFLRLLYVSWRYRILLYQAEFPAYAEACLWARRLFGGKTLLVEHNVEFARIADQFPDMPDRAKSWLKAVEIDLCNRVDRVIAVSEPDRALLIASGVDPERVVMIPHGVDLSLYEQSYDFDPRQQHALDHDVPLLVYHGIYSYHPNLEAVRLIAAELLPRLAQRGCHAKVLAIGREPPLEPVHEDVIFTGSVPNLAPYLKKMDLAVIPLQKGGGTRMKILEYFAAGVPVVATSKAIEGIPVENGVQAWIEDDFEAMADAIVTLIEDRPRAARLASAARLYVRDLDWTAIARRYLELAEWDLAPSTVSPGAECLEQGGHQGG